MIAYAESSAVLAWILGEPMGEDVRAALAESERVVSSSLTVVECARALLRAEATGRVRRAEGMAGLRLLDAAAASWAILEMTGQVLSRARAPFPVEPLRTLDALHLSAVLRMAEVLPSLVVVSLDERIRANALALGIEVSPWQGR